jgi:hypothetical protein
MNIVGLDGLLQPGREGSRFGVAKVAGLAGLANIMKLIIVG